MKCPKCGFNSFEFLNNCKKCGTDLASFKMNHGINPVVYAQGAQSTHVKQKAAPDVIREETPLMAASSAPTDSDGENSFTWDIPALNESTQEAEGGFSGFELDFMKDAEKPAETEAGFTFNEEPEAESDTLSQAGTGLPAEDFSFYEETLDPAEKPVLQLSEEVTSEQENDSFGETGIMGEISPERLQSAYQDSGFPDSIDGLEAEQQIYENEFVLDELAEADEKESGTDNDFKNDQVNFSDFEKDFESIFQTDEPSDDNKAAN
jgi:hypothetical protein